jgi:hypothetical protein
MAFSSFFLRRKDIISWRAMRQTAGVGGIYLLDETADRRRCDRHGPPSWIRCQARPSPKDRSGHKPIRTTSLKVSGFSPPMELSKLTISNFGGWASYHRVRLAPLAGSGGDPRPVR